MMTMMIGALIFAWGKIKTTQSQQDRGGPPQNNLFIPLPWKEPRPDYVWHARTAQLSYPDTKGIPVEFEEFGRGFQRHGSWFLARQREGRVGRYPYARKTSSLSMHVDDPPTSTSTIKYGSPFRSGISGKSLYLRSYQTDYLRHDKLQVVPWQFHAKRLVNPDNQTPESVCHFLLSAS